MTALAPALTVWLADCWEAVSLFLVLAGIVAVGMVFAVALLRAGRELD